jgi:hypothetical protein
MSRNPDWYYDLLDAAAEAQKCYSEDELVEYERQWRQTEEGKKWIEFVSTIKWSISPGAESFKEENVD